MNEGTRTYSCLIILRTSEGAGFPYLSQEAPREVVIDCNADTWCVPRRSSRVIPIGEGDLTAMVMINMVIGVYRMGNFQHMRQLFIDSREAHWRAMGRLPGS